MRTLHQLTKKEDDFVKFLLAKDGIALVSALCVRSSLLGLRTLEDLTVGQRRIIYRLAVVFGIKRVTSRMPA